MSKENLESLSLLVTVWLQAETEVALSSGDKVLGSGGHPDRRGGGVFPLGLLCSLGLEVTPCSLHHLGSSSLVSSRVWPAGVLAERERGARIFVAHRLLACLKSWQESWFPNGHSFAG